MFLGNPSTSLIVQYLFTIPPTDSTGTQQLDRQEFYGLNIILWSDLTDIRVINTIIKLVFTRWFVFSYKNDLLGFFSSWLKVFKFIALIICFFCICVLEQIWKIEQGNMLGLVLWQREKLCSFHSLNNSLIPALSQLLIKQYLVCPSLVRHTSWVLQMSFSLYLSLSLSLYLYLYLYLSLSWS